MCEWAQCLKLYQCETGSPTAHNTQLWLLPSLSLSLSLSLSHTHTHTHTHHWANLQSLNRPEQCVCWRPLCAWETVIFLRVYRNVHNLWRMCELGVSEDILLCECAHISLCFVPSALWSTWLLTADIFHFPLWMFMCQLTKFQSSWKLLGCWCSEWLLCFAFPCCVNRVLVSRADNCWSDSRLCCFPVLAAQPQTRHWC